MKTEMLVSLVLRWIVALRMDKSLSQVVRYKPGAGAAKVLAI
jgi:hypothetical protein